MKTPNVRVTKVVAGVMATSLMTASCTQYGLPEQLVYGNIVNDVSDLGQIAIPVSLNLKPEDAQYINAIQKATIDVINNEAVAQEFVKNPANLLKKYGYEGEINLDEIVLKLTMS